MCCCFSSVRETLVSFYCESQKEIRGIAHKLSVSMASSAGWVFNRYLWKSQYSRGLWWKNSKLSGIFPKFSSVFVQTHRILQPSLLHWLMEILRRILLLFNFSQICVDDLQNFQEFSSTFQFSFSLKAIFELFDKFLTAIIEVNGNFFGFVWSLQKNWKLQIFKLFFWEKIRNFSKIFPCSKFFLEKLEFSDMKNVATFEKWIHVLILWIVAKNENIFRYIFLLLGNYFRHSFGYSFKYVRY